MPQSSTLTYLAGDHLGSTSLAVDASTGGVTETRYKPWGEVRYTTADKTLPTRYTFTGQYSYMDDSATDLGAAGFGRMFYNARWYDPALGRFAQADSIVPGGVQGLDRYAYVGNNPIVYTDPSGHAQHRSDYQQQIHDRKMKEYDPDPEVPEDDDCRNLTCEKGTSTTSEPLPTPTAEELIADILTWYSDIDIDSLRSLSLSQLSAISIGMMYINFAFGGDMAAMRAAFGWITFESHATLQGGKAKADADWRTGKIRLTHGVVFRDIIHEMGHIFDGHSSGSKGKFKSQIWINNFNDGTCTLGAPANYGRCETGSWIPSPRTTQHGLKGPEEDFADSFADAVIGLSLPRHTYAVSADRVHMMLLLINAAVNTGQSYH